MSWVDPLVGEIEERFAKEIAGRAPLIIRDEKTLSGRVHVGSLRGIVIHALIAQALTEKGVANEFLFELNDFDPMDGLPVYVDEKKYRPHMGKPLYAVPPLNAGEESFATGFGTELQEVVNPMGLPITWYPLRPLYHDGKFNETIRDALDGAKKIRAIYHEVSGGKKPDDWYPLSVVCEQCGKIGTTQVTDWDGKEVTYSCKEKYVEWAEGCGYSGTCDPFDGRAKLPWKVEWAAKWKVLGVHIEAAGKDHYASGGSREISARISEEIFGYREPFGFLYEWLNIKGRSMSSSSGVGTSAKEIADLLPPEMLKLLMIRKNYNQPIDFDPEGRTIPNLFDEYDRLSDHYFKRHSEPFEGFARTWQLAHIDLGKEPEDLWEMRFSVMIFVVQMPHLDLEEEAQKLKGAALTKEEKESLHTRAHYVKQWIENLAPEQYKFTILDAEPSDLSLSSEQKEALGKVKEAFTDESLTWEGPAIHEKIHEVKAETGIEPKALFQALYQIFLGRDSGPQVGWFLSTFDRNAVTTRLESVIV